MEFRQPILPDPGFSSRETPRHTGVQRESALQASLSHKQTLNFKAFPRECGTHISWEFPSKGNKARRKKESENEGRNREISFGVPADKQAVRSSQRWGIL